MDREAWRASGPGVAKSQTWLGNWATTTIVAKTLAPCPLMPNRNIATEFGGNRKEQLYSFCQAKGKHSTLVPQELVPPFSGIRRGFISSWGSCTLYLFIFFFVFCKVAKWPHLIFRQLSRSNVPEVIGPQPSFWNAECYKRVQRGEAQQMQSLVCIESQSN